MLKTNSKVARENIKNYIIDIFNFDECNEYGYKTPGKNDFKAIAKIIYNAFYDEVGKYQIKRNYSIQESFEYYCSGLPGIIDTCYYYNRSAVDDLGNILEETETEKSKYSEQQAEKMLTYLIFKEVQKAL